MDKYSNISTVTITPPTTPKAPYQPFVTGGVPYGLQLGSAFNETIDPSLKTPYSIAINAGMQTQLPGDMLVMKLSYAGRLGRRLLAQADANQVLEFPDPTSGQLYSAAFAAVSNQLRAGVQPGNVTPQPWFENLIGPGLGVPKGTATQTLAKNFGPFIQRGDIGDITEFLSNYDAYNIGSAAQFSENTFFTNKGSSSYNALLLTLQKNLSHGLQFDFNYTFAHSIDNVSFFANSQGDTGIGGVGLICDDIRPRECRGNSDFDVTHYITGDETYQLPFGRNRTFLAGIPLWEEELIGGWAISGVTEWHTGIAWGTTRGAALMPAIPTMHPASSSAPRPLSPPTSPRSLVEASTSSMRCRPHRASPTLPWQPPPRMKGPSASRSVPATASADRITSTRTLASQRPSPSTPNAST